MQRHQGRTARQTRIVATIGRAPDGDWPPFLSQLCAAGADVLRLNFSHADADYAKERVVLQWANQATPNFEAPRVATMADLQGPKCRIGALDSNGLTLVEGGLVALIADSDSDTATASLTAIGVGVVVPVPQPTAGCLINGLRAYLAEHPDEQPTILFGDGDLVVQVRNLLGDAVITTVVAGGVLGSKKGLTVREIDLDLDPFPEKDQNDLLFALDHAVDFVALSFVRSPADLLRVRAFIDLNLRAGQPAPRLVAKIETLAAVHNIEPILQAADGIMVARGDLGLQLGFDEVPAVQKFLVDAARRHGRPCIVATQMLESMITATLPTRAEATDVFNAILDGGDAVMLSGETSVGSRPCLVVQTMDQIARKAEQFRSAQRHVRPSLALPPAENSGHVERINAEFARTAVQFAESLPAFAIACFTRTGNTPERISRFRPPVPIMAFCATERTARQSLLYWGVHPFVLQGFDAKQDRMAMMVQRARTILREHYHMGAGDALVLTAGVDWVRGGTNVLQVLIEDHAAAVVASDLVNGVGEASPN